MFDRQGPGSDFAQLVVLQDPSIGLRAVIALHSTRRGPAFGGIRRRAYADPDAGLSDALALAEAMSLKCALAGLDAGGGKTVLFEREGADVEACYARLGDAIEGLGGRYVCGPDLGTSDAELEIVRGYTRHVNPRGNDAGRATALGVLAGMRATWRMLDAAPEGSSAAVQGLGAVGSALAAELVRLGVRVYGADIDPGRCDAARELGVQIVPPDQILATACDVVAPCAGGAILDQRTVDQLRCRAVCGSANNQLAGETAAQRMVELGVLHAPDIVVSAGAVIEGAITVGAMGDRAAAQTILPAIERLEAVAFDIMRDASGRGVPPSVVAVERGRAIIAGSAGSGD